MGYKATVNGCAPSASVTAMEVVTYPVLIDLELKDSRLRVCAPYKIPGRCRRAGHSVLCRDLSSNKNVQGVSMSRIGEMLGIVMMSS